MSEKKKEVEETKSNEEKVVAKKPATKKTTSKAKNTATKASTKSKSVKVSPKVEEPTEGDLNAVVDQIKEIVNVAIPEIDKETVKTMKECTTVAEVTGDAEIAIEENDGIRLDGKEDIPDLSKEEYAGNSDTEASTEDSVENTLEEWYGDEVEEEVETAIKGVTRKNRFCNGPTDYSDRDRKKINIGVVCDMKEMEYLDFKRQLDGILYSLPPWEYEHKIFGVRDTVNYQHIPRYCTARNREFQPVMLHISYGKLARLKALEHLVRIVGKGGIILIYRHRVDGVINRIEGMAKLHGIEVKIVEY